MRVFLQTVKTQMKKVTFRQCMQCLLHHQVFAHYACADPESFVRGGPSSTCLFFKLMNGERIKIALIIDPQAKRHWRWCADDGPTINAGFIALLFLGDPYQYC